jgi:hypothetical protein
MSNSPHTPTIACISTHPYPTHAHHTACSYRIALTDEKSDIDVSTRDISLPTSPPGWGVFLSLFWDGWLGGRLGLVGNVCGTCLGVCPCAHRLYRREKKMFSIIDEVISYRGVEPKRPFRGLCNKHSHGSLALPRCPQCMPVLSPLFAVCLLPPPYDTHARTHARSTFRWAGTGRATLSKSKSQWRAPVSPTR